MSQQQRKLKREAKLTADRPKRRYITGFDGLRALGVIGVIMYHLRPELFQGGYLGVPIFMVVSGYLITDGLVMQYHRTGRIDFKTFFLKRIRRLYPGLIAVLFATSAYITLFNRALLHHLHMMVLTNLTYVYNWWQIAHGQSYFARFANGESPFTHLWTLSIEGQYYLIWPVIVLGLLVFVKHRTKMASVVVALAVVSAAWMALLFALHPTADPSRLYYGTDTRAFSILLGAALAFVWPIAELSDHLPKAASWTLDGIGSVSLVGLLIMTFTLSAQSGALYLGGMFGFSLLATALVAVVAHPAGHFNRLLTNPFFAYLGSRSYGIYLYQFPVMIAFEHQFTDVADHPLLYPVIEVALILVIAELSYRFIEQPVAKFDYRQLWTWFAQLVDRRVADRTPRIVVAIAAVILAIGSVGLVQAPHATAVHETQLAKRLKQTKADKLAQKKRLAAAKASIAKAKSVAANAAAASKSKEAASAAAESAAQKHPVNQKYEKYGLTQVELQKAQQIGITGVGDSVMLDGQPWLQELMPHAYIEAKVARQMSASIGQMQNLANTGALAQVVLVGLGTNGPFSRQQFDAMMRVIGPTRQVFWINVRVPTRSWQNPVNAQLAAAAKRFRNLTIIDWYGYSNSHKDWFYPDQVHPNPKGAPHYAAYITKCIVAGVHS